MFKLKILIISSDIVLDLTFQSRLFNRQDSMKEYLIALFLDTFDQVSPLNHYLSH